MYKLGYNVDCQKSFQRFLLCTVQKDLAILRNSLSPNKNLFGVQNENELTTFTLVSSQSLYPMFFRSLYLFFNTTHIVKQVA